MFRLQSHQRCTICVMFWFAISLFPSISLALDDLLSVPEEVLAAQQQRVEVMRKASAATISIFGLDGGGGGSGVIITEDGYALTNYHVSSACGDHMRCGLNDGTMVDAVIVGIDATGDVSLIKLLGRDDFPTAALANSDEVRVGQWCFAAGNPFVLASNLQPSVSLGIVSGVNRYQYPSGTLLEYADCIQTDAAVNPGNSGGPLFDLSGNIIGINGRCSFEKRGRVNVGVGYAISSNQIKYFLGVLRSGRLVDHATLGATVSTDEGGKVLVSNILNGSDAYRRGLRYGDEVVRLADREVRTTNSFKNILGTLPRDWRIPIDIRRDGKPLSLLVRLDGVHTEKELIDRVAGGLGEPQPEKPKEPGKELEEGNKNRPPAKRDSNELHEGEPDIKLFASKFEARAGFANYYFNRIKREELHQALQQLGDYPSTDKNWQLTGTLAGESTAVALTTSPGAASIKIGARNQEFNFGESLSDIVASRRESGLVLAVRALQELLQIGPEKMGASTYLGTFPVFASSDRKLNAQPLHDVIQTLWFDARVRFSIDPHDGRISLVEIFGDAGVDPVELYVDNYAAFSYGEKMMQFPSRLRLQYGTEPMLIVDINAIHFGPPAADAGAKAGDTP